MKKLDITGLVKGLPRMSLANEVSEDRLRALKSIFKRHIVDVLGNQSIKNIKPLDVQRALNKGDWSDDYAKKIYHLAKQIWHHAYKKGPTKVDPIHCRLFDWNKER